MIPNWRFHPALILAFVALPAMAFANAGTPFMWTMMFHFTLGNVTLGLCEALVLCLLLRGVYAKHADLSHRRYWQIALLLIAANYFSAILGLVANAFIDVPYDAIIRGEIPIDSLWWYLLLLAIFLWALTILLELPFVFLALPRIEYRWRKALMYGAIVQTASYLVLCFVYGRTMFVSLLTETTIEKNAAVFATPPIGDVYFLHDGKLWRVRTDGTGKEVLLEGAAERVAPMPLEEVFCRELETDENTIEVWGYGDQSTPQFLFGPVPGKASESMGTTKQGGMDVPPVRGPGEFSSFRGFYGDVKVVPAWYGVGTSSPAQSHYYLAVETAGQSWRTSHATLLPSGQAVFQADDHILLIDAVTLQIAEIAEGRSPVVVYQAEDLEGANSVDK